jgi:hypothetical protein
MGREARQGGRHCWRGVNRHARRRACAAVPSIRFVTDGFVLGSVAAQWVEVAVT